MIIGVGLATIFLLDAAFSLGKRIGKVDHISKYFFKFMGLFQKAIDSNHNHYLPQSGRNKLSEDPVAHKHSSQLSPSY